MIDLSVQTGGKICWQVRYLLPPLSDFESWRKWKANANECSIKGSAASAI